MSLMPMKSVCDYIREYNLLDGFLALLLIGLLGFLFRTLTRSRAKYKKVKIFITIDRNKVPGWCKFGVLHVRDGRDDSSDKGPLMNRVKYFCYDAHEGRYVAHLRMNRVLGLQYKCFVDHDTATYEDVLKFLSSNNIRLEDISKGESVRKRAWFLLPGKAVVATPEGKHNNYAYPE